MSIISPLICLKCKCSVVSLNAFRWSRCVGCHIVCASISFASMTRVSPSFNQIDIIGAMVIVWRVRGKIIRSVLCNIVCNNCVQCNARTYEQT